MGNEAFEPDLAGCTVKNGAPEVADAKDSPARRRECKRVAVCAGDVLNESVAQERRPLAVYLLLVVLLTTAIIGFELTDPPIESAAGVAQVFFEMLAAPLRLFRAQVDKPGNCGVNCDVGLDAVYVVAQVVGVILVGFSILALARLTRASRSAT
jgi:hypothetical protein